MNIIYINASEQFFCDEFKNVSSWNLTIFDCESRIHSYTTTYTFKFCGFRMIPHLFQKIIIDHLCLEIRLLDIEIKYFVKNQLIFARIQLFLNWKKIFFRFEILTFTFLAVYTSFLVKNYTSRSKVCFFFLVNDSLF